MKTHRGLSAIVGTVFLVAVMVSALSYVSYSLDIMGNFSESLIAEESRQNDKQSEAFEISTIDVVGGKLGGVIKNTGEIPIKLTTLWIDEQGVNDVVQKFTLDAEMASGKTVNLQSLVDFDLDPTKGYNMKVVSSRGEVNSFYVNSLANENVYMKLTATPSIIPSTFTSTLLFTVVNNMSNGNYLYNLTPILNDTSQTLDADSTGLSYELITGPLPLTYDSLGPGEVGVFTYEIGLTGATDNDLQLFNVTLANANAGNEALASVSIKAVPLATDAGSALTSLGLTESDSDLTDVLYFHADTTLTPLGEYGMDGSSPNSAGLTKSPNGNTLEFITTGMTADTTLPAGVFNVALTYFSNPVPLNLPEPSFMFMMDEKDSGDNEEIADMINLFDPDKGFKEGGNDPEFGISEDPDGAHTSGPRLATGHDAGFFHFDGGDYFYDDWDVNGGTPDDYTEIQAYDTSTALWIRVNPTGDTHQGIMTWGYGPGSGQHEDGMYIAVVTGGELQFAFTDEHIHDGYERYCTSPLEYDDNIWHHVVVKRDGGYCELWVDNVLVDSDGSEGGSGAGSIDVDRLNIGYDAVESDFDGDIASVIHWNQNVLLSAAQIEDLYYTNYGNNGTRLSFIIEHVDTAGTTVLETIVPLTETEIPFYDPSRGNTNNEGGAWTGLHSSNTTDKKYGLFNMTATTVSGSTLLVGERLKITLDWEPWGNEHNLPINIMFDDSSGWTLPSGPTFMQTPPPDPRWPSFLAFDSREEIQYSAFNEGPEGIWFTYGGTRLVLTSLDGLNSFGATPRYVNQTTAPSQAEAEINPSRDSMYIPDQYFAEIDFWPIQAPPDASVNFSCAPECEVTNGDYDAAIYLQGYDESGETFKKTISLGLVHITGNP